MTTEYYYDKLPEQSKVAYTRLCSAIERGKEHIFLGPLMETQQIQPLLKALHDDHPELFYVDLPNSETQRTLLGLTVHLRYLHRGRSRARMLDAIHTSTAPIIEEALAHPTAAARFRVLHDRLTKTVQHITRQDAAGLSAHAFGIHGAFVEKKANSVGYAKAYKYLCDCLDLPSFIVTGKRTWQASGREVPHCWNIIQCGADRAHVDASLNHRLSGDGFERFDYYAISDADCRLDHSFGGYPVCRPSLLDPFLERGARIHSEQALLNYLEKATETIIYFKLEQSAHLPKNVIERVDSVVYAGLQTLFPERRYRSVHNPAQHIFCYRPG